MKTEAPTLHTDHLILRAFQPEDAEAYHVAVLSDPVAVRALPTGRPVPVQRSKSIIAGIVDHWESNGFGLWAVTLEGQLIGHCGLQGLDRKAQVEFTYAMQAQIDADLAVEAGRAVLHYAFDDLALEEVVAVIFPENTAAKRVYSRLEMRLQRRQIHAYDQYLPYYVLNRGDFSYGG